MAVVLLSVPVANADDGERSETNMYVGGTDLVVFCGGGWGQGGVCFDAERGTRSVSLSARSFAGIPEGGYWWIVETHTGAVYSRGAFCGDSGPIPTPQHAAFDVTVVMDGVFQSAAYPGCGHGLPATAGTVTAVFS